LEPIDTADLVSLLLEVSQLGHSPSTVASILETFTTEKTVDIIQYWISTEDLNILGQVLENVLPEKTILYYSKLAFLDREVLRARALPFPDMALTSLSVSKINSRDYVISAIIENTGNVESTPFKFSFYIDSIFLRREEAPELSVEESLNISINWRPLTPGDHTLSFIIDPDNEVSEVNEVNNLLSQVYRVLVPDLVLNSVNAFSIVVEGEPSNVEVEVSNIGDFDANNVNLTVIANGVVIESDKVKYVSYTIGSIDIPIIGPKIVNTYFFNWEPEAPGTYSLKAVVDPLGEIFESEKMNNENLMNIVVEAKPSFTGYWIVIDIIVTLSIPLLFFRKQVLKYIRIGYDHFRALATTM
jgi:hypothetical protein